jgi:hypothetical protein
VNAVAALLRALTRVVVLAVLVAAPSVAAACPACLGNPRNMGVLKLLGVLILTPFAVFWFVYRAIRRATLEPPPPR